MRGIIRLMASLSGIEPKSANIFHRNLGETSMPTHEIPNIIDNHSSHTFHDEDDSLTRVSPTQVVKLGHDLKKLEYWMGEEQSNNEVIPLIEVLRRMVQYD